MECLQLKTRIRETKNLLTDVDSSTAAKKLLSIFFPSPPPPPPRGFWAKKLFFYFLLFYRLTESGKGLQCSTTKKMVFSDLISVLTVLHKGGGAH